MREHNLDALFLTEWENVYYLSGFQVIGFASTRDWPFVLIVKKNGDTTIIVRGGMERIAREESWISNIKGYNRISDAGNAILDVLSTLGLKGARVGAELGEMLAVKFSTGLFLELVKTAGVDFVDGSKAIWDTRMRKTKFEVDRLREAAQIASRAGERAFGELRVGMTECEFAGLIGRYMMEEGADRIQVMSVRSGERFRKRLWGCFPTERPIEKGDYVQVDFGAVRRNYVSDLNRIAIVGGQPTAAEKAHWDLYAEANRKGTEAVKPGVTAADLFAAMARVFEEAGLKVDAQRFGHGLGLEAHEPPNLSPYDKTVIMPGMALAIEPQTVLSKEGIFFNCEDDVVCTETGVERLSTIKREIFTA